MLKKGDKKLINAWAFYDWANSVYSLVIGTAVFPIYFQSITSQNNPDGIIRFLGSDFHNSTLLSYSLSISFLIVAIMSPILSGIADYTGNKKRFMQFFCYLGSFSVMALFFFEDLQTLWIGILFTILASIGFWGSIVYYNSYLPEIAHIEDHDKVSAKGFMMGYSGSILLLIINLLMVMKPELFGFAIENSTLPARYSFLMVGIWWLVFAQYTFYYLPNNTKQKPPEKDYIFNGLKELKTVFLGLKNQLELKQFLTAFFLYSVGVNTIILLLGIFVKDEIGIATDKLIIIIILIQIVAIFGAYFFSKISTQFGNLTALKITIAIWGIICLTIFLLNSKSKNIDIYVYLIGAAIGMVLGAIQSISRSTYSKLLPDTNDNTTYFSFFDVTEKIAIVFGTFIFGFVAAITNSMRNSVLVLAFFFLAGFIVLSFMNKFKKN